MPDRVDMKPDNASFQQNFTHPALKRLDRDTAKGV